MFLSIGACIPLYLNFSLSSLNSMILFDCAPDVSSVVGLVVPVVFGVVCERRFTETSSSDHCCK